MIQATQLRRGNTILHNGELFQVVDYQHITPGNWRGMVQTKLRNLRTGAIVDHRFRSEDRCERAILDDREMEYLYADGTDHHFMDTQNYEQIHLNEDILGDSAKYLVANSKIHVQFYEGRPLGVDLPATVDLKVIRTDPGMPSATVSNVMKPATMETGLVVGVPHFIQEGEVIRVDTTEGKYVERVPQLRLFSSWAEYETTLDPDADPPFHAAGQSESMAGLHVLPEYFRMRCTLCRNPWLPC